MYDESGQLGLHAFEYQRKSKAVEFITAKLLYLVTSVCVICMTGGQRNCATERLQKLQETTLVMFMIACWTICHLEPLGNDKVVGKPRETKESRRSCPQRRICRSGTTSQLQTTHCTPHMPGHPTRLCGTQRPFPQVSLPIAMLGQRRYAAN